MDVTESPIERPKYDGQKRFFSGKQKRHTLKSQFVIDLETKPMFKTRVEWYSAIACCHSRAASWLQAWLAAWLE